jgi:hypothetical protein
MFTDHLESRMSIRTAALTFALLNTFALQAAHATRTLPPAARATRVVTITASDYAFDMPTRIDPGLVTFRLVNRGRELHHAFIARLNQPGLTPSAFVAQIQPNKEFPTNVELMGGPNSPGLGGTSEVTVRLTPGTYVVLCVFSTADGTSHVGKGQKTVFTVTGNAPLEAEPATTASITFTEYGFTPSPRLKAGAHRLRLINNTKQPHELFMAKLKPNAKARDVLGWMAMRTANSPVEQLGGSTPLSPGHDAWVDITLTPGRYALFCFMPDAKDGTPHLAHGSMSEITVLSATSR